MAISLMKNFFPLPQRTQCEWCHTMANIYVFDTDNEKAPICQKHYEFFTEPVVWWAWKQRMEKI